MTQPDDIALADLTPVEQATVLAVTAAGAAISVAVQTEGVHRIVLTLRDGRSTVEGKGQSREGALQAAAAQLSAADA